MDSLQIRNRVNAALFTRLVVESTCLSCIDQRRSKHTSHCGRTETSSSLLSVERADDLRAILLNGKGRNRVSQSVAKSFKITPTGAHLQMKFFAAPRPSADFGRERRVQLRPYGAKRKKSANLPRSHLGPAPCSVYQSHEHQPRIGV